MFFLCYCGSEFEILLDSNIADIQPRVFWTEMDGGIRQISTGGTGRKTVLTLPDPPLDIALYMPGRKMYWTTFSSNSGAYQIRSAGIDGSGEQLFYTSAVSDHGPTAITIDSENAVIYWNQRSASLSNDIWRSELSISAKEKWINSINKPYTYSICLDAINRKIYFTANYYWFIDSEFGSGNQGHIYIYELDTSNTIIYEIPVGTGPSANSIPFMGIAVDGIRGNTYYVSNTTTSLCIMKADLSLQGPVEWILSSGFGIQKLALDLKERKIYWTSDTDNSIYRADIDTQNSRVQKFIQAGSRPTGIAIVY